MLTNVGYNTIIKNEIRTGQPFPRWLRNAMEHDTSKNLKQVVYEELKRRIVSCEILPGSMLTEEMLCESLNASRTPVRDAVSRLEQENLVSILPKKGIRVNRVSLNNVEELFVTRLFVEPQLVLTYGNRILMATGKVP